MGLRINHNISALESLRNLGAVDRVQSRTLERLSTGLRINRAADDPSGLVISEQLRAQTATLQTAVRNTQTDINLINTTEAALNEVNSLLVGIREALIFSLDSAHDTDEIEAKQRSVDRAIDSIDRIAATTRFGKRSLLNGDSDFRVQSKNAFIDALKVRSVRFANNQTSITFRLKVSDLASRAVIKLASAGNNGGMSATSNVNRLLDTTVIASSAFAGAASGTGQVITLRITGALGSEDIALASGATIRDFIAAVNAITNSTGVFASSSPAPSNPNGVPIVGASGFSFGLYSIGFGSSQRITLENLTASGQEVGLVNFLASSNGYNVGLVRQGFFTSDTGDDLKGQINGTQVVAEGYTVRVTSNFLDAEIDVSEQVYAISRKAGASGIVGSQVHMSGLDFVVLNNRQSGLTFQLNSEGSSIDRLQVGIQSIRTSELGARPERENAASGAASNLSPPPGGFLSSLKSGNGNDLTQNAVNALSIVDSSIAQVNDLRAFLGSVQKFSLEPALSSLGVAISNITSTESQIRDLDFAAETTEFVKNQVLFQAATSVLASANLIPQTVLSLLQ